MINTLVNCFVYEILKYWSYQICKKYIYIKGGTSFRRDPLDLKERIILYTSSASVLQKRDDLLIAWMFATGLLGDLGAFASRDGATSAKRVLNIGTII